MSLPEGWAKTSLGAVCSKPQYGWTSKAAKQGRIRYLRTTDISNGKIDWETVPFCALEPESVEKYQIHKDDVVVSRAGSVGVSIRIEEIPQQTVFASYLIRFNPSSAALPKYVEYFLKSHDYWRSISEYSAGIAVPNVNASKLAEIEFPLAPLNEQKRIVEKLEKLLGKVEAAQERLDRIPAILKRFRQSVLAAACSGRLTPDWRESSEIDSDTGFPEGWSIVELGSLFPKGGIFDGPFGSNLKSSDYSESGVRVLRLENVGHLNFIGEKETYIDTAKYETLKKHTVGEGDIIFASFIADEIRACILPKLETMAIAKADCFCLRPNDEVDRKYLVFQLVNRRTYDELVGFVHGATRPRINTTQLKTLTLPICSPEEQKEIVRRVEELFKFADQIEERYKKARSYTDKLTQSILAKAFRGELVPQDPTDEPASVLLERISKEKI